MVLKSLFFTVLNLEIPRDRYMHPTRSRAWEWSNLGFPIHNMTNFVAYKYESWATYKV